MKTKDNIMVELPLFNLVIHLLLSLLFTLFFFRSYIGILFIVLGLLSVIVFLLENFRTSYGLKWRKLLFFSIIMVTMGFIFVFINK